MRIVWLHATQLGSFPVTAQCAVTAAHPSHPVGAPPGARAFPATPRRPGNAASRPGALLRGFLQSAARCAATALTQLGIVWSRHRRQQMIALTAPCRSAPGREGFPGNPASRPGALLRGLLQSAARCAATALTQLGIVWSRHRRQQMIALTAPCRSAPGREGLPGNAISRPGALLRVPALMHHTQPRLRNHASGTSMLSTITPNAQ